MAKQIAYGEEARKSLMRGIDQLADRTFLQFRYRHGCSNIVLCILWLIITTCRQQDEQ